MESYFFLTRTKNLSNIDSHNLIEHKMVQNNICQRCGTKLQNLHLDIPFCQACEEMGKITINTVFYQRPYQLYNNNRISKIDLNLTALQTKASKFIKKNLSLNQEILIWAVCGAGKTEITFKAIEEIINQNKYVAFAIPRIDILYEIAERLKEYFPNNDIVILNSHEKIIQHGQLYVLTTNQLLNFYQAFSLIIVDEADAYPFADNQKFKFGLTNALREHSTVVYLTSTPSDALKKLDKKFIIYKRWHNHKLPIPFVIQQNLISLNFNLIPYKLSKYLNSKRQKLIFLASKQKVEHVSLILNKHGYSSEFCHSHDQERLTKVQLFREGKIQILVTTSILERGVTFNNLDVFVLDSSNEYYTVANLVQIAGRVGRKKDFQEGIVIFFYQNKTKILYQALHQIKYMNSLNK